MIIETETIEKGEKEYKVEYIFDDYSNAPWENMDTLGTVTNWENRDKAPGELVLCSDRGSKRFYDIQEATAEVRSWEKDGQKAAEIARSEYEYIKAWCANEWYYVGISATLLDNNENETDYVHSLWGIEYGMQEFEKYHAEIISELIVQIDYEIDIKCNPVADFGV